MASATRSRRSPAREQAAVGDLFAHFGLEPEAAREPPAAIVAAAPCSTCGWLCRADEPGRACPLCAAAIGSE